jgi:hypothetical protein
MGKENVNEIKHCRISSLKELSFGREKEDCELLKTYLEIFSNLEKLNCDDLSRFSFKIILENCTKLREIKTRKFRVEKFCFVKLPSLKVLEIETLHPTHLDAAWKILVENCCNIEKLVIKMVKNSILRKSYQKEIGIIINNVSKLQKLEYFEIATDYEEYCVENSSFKVFFDKKRNIVTVSRYFELRCVQEMNILKQMLTDCCM